MPGIAFSSASLALLISTGSCLAAGAFGSAGLAASVFAGAGLAAGFAGSAPKPMLADRTSAAIVIVVLIQSIFIGFSFVVGIVLMADLTAAAFSCQSDISERIQ